MAASLAKPGKEKNITSFPVGLDYTCNKTMLAIDSTSYFVPILRVCIVIWPSLCVWRTRRGVWGVLWRTRARALRPLHIQAYVFLRAVYT